LRNPLQIFGETTPTTTTTIVVGERRKKEEQILDRKIRQRRMHPMNRPA
jgi:hypothetical protein